jgi:hypothetical protein
LVLQLIISETNFRAETGLAGSSGDPRFEEYKVNISNISINYSNESFRTIRFLRSRTAFAVQSTVPKNPNISDLFSNPSMALKYNLPIEGIKGIDQLASYIGGTTELLTKQKIRYIGNFRTSFNNKLVVIQGTGLHLIDLSTGEIESSGIDIVPSDRIFSGAILGTNLYISDGLTKIHIYEFNRVVRIKRWGFSGLNSFADVGGISGAETGTGTQGGTFQYAIGLYNAELDQYSGMIRLNPSTGDGLQVIATSCDSITLNFNELAAFPSHLLNDATHIAIYRTTDIASGGNNLTFNLLAFVPIGSTGHVDWLGASTLGFLYPRDILGSGVISPPLGSIVAEHLERIWISGVEDRPDDIFFSRIDGQMHGGVLTAETYLYPADHFINIPGGRSVTGIASLLRNMYVFTRESLDVITGNNPFNFTRDRIHEGIGCVSHLTIKKWANNLIWLGLDDVYVLRGGIPEPLDGEGRIKEFLKNNTTASERENAQAALNINSRLYELYIGDIVSVFDLIPNEGTTVTDIDFSYVAQILDGSITRVFIGTNKGFIVKQDDSGQNYQPPSGSIRTTVSSYTSLVITTVAVDLYTTDAGLEGNIIYVVDSNGSVMKGICSSNTGSTITLESLDLVWGTSFTPVSGDEVLIGPIFWHLKTAINAIDLRDNIGRDAFFSQGLIIPDYSSMEVVDIGLVHKVTSSCFTCPLSYMRLIREEGNPETPVSIDAIGTLSKPFTKVHFSDSSKAQFYSVDMYFLHEDAIFDLIGLVYGLNLTGESFLAN